MVEFYRFVLLEVLKLHNITELLDSIDWTLATSEDQFMTS